MKKGFIAILVLLAVIVLISPAIVGRLAEQSMDENLNWAANSSGEVRVTSEHFTRGWFSSEGQHRIELQDGELLAALETLSGPMPADELPVLVINTTLDHGLIPVSSMSREQGSLAPGLGSAVSTMVVELPDGDTFAVPGAIYSKIGLSGELLSNYILDAGSHAEGDTTASWGTTNIEIKASPTSGEAVFRGSVGALSIDAGAEMISLGGLTFEGEHLPTRHGISVGNIEMALDDFSMVIDGNNVGGLKSMLVKAVTDLDGDKVNADASISVAMHELPQFGEMTMDMAFELLGADAAAIGSMQRSLERLGSNPDPMAVYGTLEADVKDLFAAGFELNFERFDLSLPQGRVESKMLFTFEKEDSTPFEWTSLLLNTRANVDLSIPEALVNMMIESTPQAAMAVGGGYLVKRGDVYVLNAEMKKGLLTVNGAPIPLPLGAVR